MKSLLLVWFFTVPGGRLFSFSWFKAEGTCQHFLKKEGSGGYEK
jgi:hypothetical protein